MTDDVLDDDLGFPSIEELKRDDMIMSLAKDYGASFRYESEDVQREEAETYHQELLAMNAEELYEEYRETFIENESEWLVAVDPMTHCIG